MPATYTNGVSMHAFAHWSHKKGCAHAHTCHFHGLVLIDSSPVVAYGPGIGDPDVGYI